MKTLLRKNLRLASMLLNVKEFIPYVDRDFVCMYHTSKVFVHDMASSDTNIKQKSLLDYILGNVKKETKLRTSLYYRIWIKALPKTSCDPFILTRGDL